MMSGGAVFDHRVRESTCPACERSLDGALGDGAAPAPGDLSVCAYCATYLAFDDDLQLRPLTSAEYDALPSEERYALMRARSVVIRVLA